MKKKPKCPTCTKTYALCDCDPIGHTVVGEQFEIVKIRNGQWEVQKDGKTVSQHSTEFGARAMLCSFMENVEKNLP
jgi:hypothetical protein